MEKIAKETKPIVETLSPSKKKPQGMIRDYWPRYWRRALVLCITMQVAVTFAICYALIVSGVMQDDLLIMIVAIAILAATIGINLVMTWLLLSPLQSLAAALTHIAGEPTDMKPPNPNASRFSTDGFNLLLRQLYELSVKKSNHVNGTIGSSIVERALDETNTGFVILDGNREIIYANKAAPVRTNTANKQELELIFSDQNDTLSKWLDKRELSDVHAEHMWRRVPNKIVGQEDRRIFDVIASYEKGSEAETVLVFYDYSDYYKPADDALDFIAFAAHELRGPITVIRGYLDVLGDELSGKLDSEERELLQRLVVSSNRLSSYISNILNASRFDRQHFKIHLAEHKLSDIYDSIRDDMAERARTQNRLLSIDFPDNLPTVAADSGSLSEVLSNLIDNAIKYSNEGGSVSVTAREKNDRVVVSVEDRGIGMPTTVVSSLFHKFYRSHRSRETVAGTGIGLYISKAIVESHGGQISVSSVEGEGSTFEFSLLVYSSVKDKLIDGRIDNKDVIPKGDNWIENHSMYRG